MYSNEMLCLCKQIGTITTTEPICTMQTERNCDGGIVTVINYFRIICMLQNHVKSDDLGALSKSVRLFWIAKSKILHLLYF